MGRGYQMVFDHFWHYMVCRLPLLYSQANQKQNSAIRKPGWSLQSSFFSCHLPPPKKDKHWNIQKENSWWIFRTGWSIYFLLVWLPPFPSQVLWPCLTTKGYPQGTNRAPGQCLLLNYDHAGLNGFLEQLFPERLRLVGLLIAFIGGMAPFWYQVQLCLCDTDFIWLGCWDDQCWAISSSVNAIMERHGSRCWVFVVSRSCQGIDLRL